MPAARTTEVIPASRPALAPKWLAQLTSVCVLLASLSLARHAYCAWAEHMWGANAFPLPGHSRVERFWRFLHDDVSRGDERFMYVVLGTAWGALVYWVVGGGLGILDLWAPKWAVQYRNQEAHSRPVDPKLYLKTARLVLFNQFVVGIPMALVLFPLAKRNGATFRVEDIPSFDDALVHFFFYVLIVETGFFWAHYLVHQKPLYRLIHKIHHEHTAPFAITARYAHPVEDILANMLPVMGGSILLGSHMLVAWSWVAVALVTTLLAHSGFHFPFAPSNERHDYHHKYFNYCYGTLGFWDWVLQTDFGGSAPFAGSVQADRDFISTSLTPVNQMIPDRPNRMRAKAQ